MVSRRIACVSVALSIAAAPAFAQSLGELARQEEARRAAAAKPAKTISNADLKPGEVSSLVSPASPASPANCYMSIRLGRCISADEMIARSVAGSLTKENAPFEQQYRKDAQLIRSQIEKTRGSIATLEAVLADPARSTGDKRSAEQALTAARQALAGFERQWVRLEVQAGTQKIPRAWIEPIPALTARLP